MRSFALPRPVPSARVSTAPLTPTGLASTLLVSTLLVSTLLLSACGGAGEEDTEGEGRLVATPASGAVVPPAEDGGATDAAFGGILLCTELGVEATIRRVRYASAVPSASMRPVIREIPSSEARPTEPDSASPSTVVDWNPVTAVRGDLFGERLPQTLGGELVPEVEGYVVDAECGPAAAGAGHTELLTGVSATPQGAWSRYLEIDYEVDGVLDTVEVPGEFAICGSAVTELAECEQYLASPEPEPEPEPEESTSETADPEGKA